MHFPFRHCHNLEFQFVVSFLFEGGDKPTFKTTAGWCVAHRKGFAWKECRELTPRERNIDFAESVAVATAKKVTKLLLIFGQCDVNLPQRVPTTPGVDLSRRHPRFGAVEVQGLQRGETSRTCCDEGSEVWHTPYGYISCLPTPHSWRRPQATGETCFVERHWLGLT